MKVFMDKFSTTGDHRFDYWLINKKKDWATIPANTIDGYDVDIPVRLQRGTRSFGQEHIIKKHNHWLRKQKISLLELFSLKLSQPGIFYSTKHHNKVKLAMRLPPDCLAVLRYEESDGGFFTLVTLYKKRGAIKGKKVGYYQPTFKTKR